MSNILYLVLRHEDYSSASCATVDESVYLVLATTDKNKAELVKHNEVEAIAKKNISSVTEVEIKEVELDKIYGDMSCTDEREFCLFNSFYLE